VHAAETHAGIDQAAVEGGHAEEDVRLVALDHRRDARRVGPFGVEHDGGAQAQAGEEGVGERVGEEQLGAGIEAVLRARTEEVAGEHVGITDRAVGMEDALGAAGGAGGVEQERRIVVGCLRGCGRRGGALHAAAPFAEVDRALVAERTRGFVLEQRRGGARVQHQVGELRGGGARVDRDRPHPRPQHADEGGGPFDAVGQREHAGVAGAQPGVEQGRGAADGIGTQAGVVDADIALDQRDPRGIAGEQPFGGVHDVAPQTVVRSAGARGPKWDGWT
jgi:hypothetical protein